MYSTSLKAEWSIFYACKIDRFCQFVNTGFGPLSCVACARKGGKRTQTPCYNGLNRHCNRDKNKKKKHEHYIRAYSARVSLGNCQVM